MSNSDKLGSEIDQVVSELKKLKCELAEWIASQMIKVEQRIIRKVREKFGSNQESSKYTRICRDVII